MAVSTISTNKYHAEYTSEYVNKKINLYYRNGVVTLSLRELKNISSGLTLIVTVPTFLVNSEIDLYHDVYSNGQMFRFIIEHNGKISVYNYGSAISGVDNSCFLITYVTY